MSNANIVERVTLELNNSVEGVEPSHDGLRQVALTPIAELMDEFRVPLINAQCFNKVLYRTHDRKWIEEIADKDLRDFLNMRDGLAVEGSKNTFKTGGGKVTDVEEELKKAAIRAQRTRRFLEAYEGTFDTAFAAYDLSWNKQWEFKIGGPKKPVHTKDENLNRPVAGASYDILDNYLGSIDSSEREQLEAEVEAEVKEEFYCEFSPMAEVAEHMDNLFARSQRSILNGFCEVLQDRLMKDRLLEAKLRPSLEKCMQFSRVAVRTGTPLEEANQGVANVVGILRETKHRIEASSTLLELCMYAFDLCCGETWQRGIVKSLSETESKAHITADYAEAEAMLKAALS